jgi:hypothetical protein
MDGIMKIEKELEDILKKPGREWTPDEARKVSAAMKQHGRDNLKAHRKTIYTKPANYKKPQPKPKEDKPT